MKEFDVRERARSLTEWAEETYHLYFGDKPLHTMYFAETNARYFDAGQVVTADGIEWSPSWRVQVLVSGGNVSVEAHTTTDFHPVGELRFIDTIVSEHTDEQAIERFARVLDAAGIPRRVNSDE